MALGWELGGRNIHLARLDQREILNLPKLAKKAAPFMRTCLA
jgi:hypothetical protein